MPSGIDPNVFASLAQAYVGGMRAPQPGQEGYIARVDATGHNIEYTPPIGSVIASGTVQLDDLGNPVDVPCTAIAATSFVQLMLTIASNQGPWPTVAITAGVGFAIQGEINDGSTFAYRVLL